MMQANAIRSRRERLREGEKAVAAYTKARASIGRALKEIRDNELYKEAGFKTFTTYCKETIDLTKREADEYIKLATLASLLHNPE